LLLIIAAAAILLVVAPFLAPVYWAFEFANFLSLHCAVLLLLIAPLLLVTRGRLEAAISAAFAALGILFVIPFYIPAGSPASCETVQRALLINLLKENEKYQTVRDYIRSANPDIVIFLEVTPAWDAALRSLGEEYPYWESWPRADHTGIGILSRIRNIEAEIVTLGEDSPPSIVSQFDLQGLPVLLIGTHPPPPLGPVATETRRRHFQELAKVIHSHNGPTVVLGDLNMTSRAWLFQWFTHETNLRDTRLGFGLQPSFPVRFPALRIDLDHAFVSPELAVRSRELGPDIGSDHFPVELDYSIQCCECFAQPPGPS
jgi:endonuclease/exonuclease/phosphatase (EEP) superfamily protein YafD